MARRNARQRTKGAPRLRDLVTFDEEEFVMKAYAIAAETIKDQTARRWLRRSFRSAGSSSYAEGT